MVLLAYPVDRLGVRRSLCVPFIALDIFPYQPRRDPVHGSYPNDSGPGIHHSFVHAEQRCRGRGRDRLRKDLGICDTNPRAYHQEREKF